MWVRIDILANAKGDHENLQSMGMTQTYPVGLRKEFYKRYDKNRVRGQKVMTGRVFDNFMRISLFLPTDSICILVPRHLSNNSNDIRKSHLEPLLVVRLVGGRCSR